MIASFDGSQFPIGNYSIGPVISVSFGLGTESLRLHPRYKQPGSQEIIYICIYIVSYSMNVFFFFNVNMSKTHELAPSTYPTGSFQSFLDFNRSLLVTHRTICLYMGTAELFTLVL